MVERIVSREKQDQAKLSCPKGQSCIMPIPEKTLSEKAVLVINDLTVRQLAAALGAEYDPLTKEYFSPREIKESKAAMLGLGFSRTLSGPIKLTEELIVAIETKYGATVANKISSYAASAIHPKNPLKTDAIVKETQRLLVSQGNAPTCGHNSCVMVLDTLGKKVDVNELIKQIPPSDSGIFYKDVSRLLTSNGVENLALSGRTISDIERYTNKGTPIIVRISNGKIGEDAFSHFVVVDGITEKAGQKVVVIRDPHNVSYYTPIASFKKYFTGDTVIPRNYK